MFSQLTEITVSLPVSSTDGRVVSGTSFGTDTHSFILLDLTFGVAMASFEETSKDMMES